MKIAYYLPFLFLFLSICFPAESQDTINANFTKFTPDSIKFEYYFNKITANNFFTSPIIKENIAKCQAMIDQGSNIPDHLKFVFALEKVIVEQNNDNYIKSFQILKEAKQFIDSPGVTKNKQNQFRYVQAFTVMILGDYESAQKTYYDMLEEGEENNDTDLITQALFSLGQLYEKKEDFGLAKKYYLQIYKMLMDAGGIKGYEIQIYPEIIKTYLKMGNFERAETYNNEALSMVDSSVLVNLKANFLLYKSAIELDKSHISKAKKAYEKAFEIATKNENLVQLRLCAKQNASVLEKEGKFNEALKIYSNLLEKEDIYYQKLEWSIKSQEVSAKMNNFETAFKYSMLTKSIEDSLKNAKKMQQTELLAIKYEVNQKEKINSKLKAEMLTKEIQQNYLFGIITIFILSLFILIGAFFQKLRYNNRLKNEVKFRTKELIESNNLLSQSNKELEEFNRILSHDLKEPLRSIVSFSSMAKKALKPESEISEYMGYISKSGQQLNQLIDDVSKFQSDSDFSHTAPAEWIESAHVIESITQAIESLIKRKNVVIQYPDLPKMFTQKNLLFLVFKNLIENGIKFNQSSQPIIQIRHRKDSNFRYFEVEDNGIGIHPDFHEKIFGMFQRLNSRKNYLGSGLGLSKAHKIVRKMKGNIKVLRSEEGIGSVFEVSFPISKEV